MITASHDGHANEVGYTLNVYGGQGVDLAWDENVPEPPYTERVTGSFTTKNSGGNATYPTFMLNPQYHLRLHPPKTKLAMASTSASRAKVKTSIVLKTGRSVPVNVLVAWSQGERIYTYVTWQCSSLDHTETSWQVIPAGVGRYVGTLFVRIGCYLEGSDA